MAEKNDSSRDTSCNSDFVLFVDDAKKIKEIK